MFYASLVGGTDPLVWNNSIVTQGVDGTNNPALMTPQGFYLLPLAITLNVKNGLIAIAWTFTDSNTALGYIYYSTSQFSNLIWSAPAILAAPTVDFYATCQIVSWAMGAGIGFMFASVGNDVTTRDQEETQFILLAVTPTVCLGDQGFKIRIYDKGAKTELFYNKFARDVTASSPMGQSDPNNPDPTSPQEQEIRQALSPRFMTSPMIVLPPGTLQIEITNLSPYNNLIQILFNFAIPLGNKSTNVISITQGKD